MLRTNIYLDERQLESLDRIAAAGEVSRSAVIREILDQTIFGVGGGAGSDIAVLEECFGAVPDAEFPDRRLSARDKYLADLWES
ncbi:MAG: ribbon-helix-helix domain-containing protein [Bifidobacteriaceae bacterium]|jgi:hypothetical protein|nr:ribbon-helix-helix domain-containing protein [Bifidobacteriaceae bacterium]